MALRMRDDLANLEPYDPDMREVEVMLSANENSYGVPEEVRREMARRLADVPVHRYPEATCRRLRCMLGDLWGADPTGIVVGNGGDELIFNLLLAFGGPGRTMVNCTPTFSAYALYAQLTGTVVKNVRRNEDFSLDEGAVLEAASQASVIFLTSPNNPTGNLVRPAFVESLAASTDALIVVDEAYGDFADSSASCIGLVERRDNVCVLKTLSKAYALAGARIGFVIASPSVANGLLAVRQPYSVSRFDQTAAEVAVEMSDALMPARDALVRERPALIASLGRLATDLETAYGRPVLEVYPSDANFVLVRILEGGAVPTANEVHECLASDYSVLVRNFSSTPGLAGCLRITVGTPDEHGRLLSALRHIFGVPAACDGDEGEGND